jgi:hypothetical protein
MTHLISLPGYTLKDGKVAKSPKRMSVSKRIAQRKSKKVTVNRKGKLK